MTELIPYTPAPTPAPQARDVVDGWAQVMVPVSQLATQIAGTDFVPRGLRGSPAAVAAAILTGRELGIGPMTSLAHLAVIEGRPSMSAQLMRALVQAGGHSIAVRESTSTRCVIAGRRRGEQDWSTVTWSMDDARQARLDGKQNWRSYPRQMLQARCTGELCRMIFADVLGGMAYTLEEVGDIGPDGFEPETVAPPPATRRVARASKPAAAPAPPPPALPQPKPPAEPSLPGDEPPADIPADPNAPATGAQARLIMLQLGEIEPGLDRDRRLRISQAILARPLDTFADLTAREAAQLIDTLIRVKTADDVPTYLHWLIHTGEAAMALATAEGVSVDDEQADDEDADDTDPPLHEADPAP